MKYRIAETFEGENFHEFRGSDAIRESFLHEMGVAHIAYYLVGGESTEVFSTKSYISRIRESFLPRKFPAIRYEVNLVRVLTPSSS